MFEWIVEKSIEINVAHEMVWECFANPSVSNGFLCPHKYEGIERDGPFAVGTTGVIKIKHSKPLPFSILEIKDKTKYSILYRHSGFKEVILETYLIPLSENRVMLLFRQQMKGHLVPIMSREIA